MRTAIQDILYVFQAVTALGCLWGIVRLRQARRAVEAIMADRTSDREHHDNASLADWARNTKITVHTVTGTWVSMTLAELAVSPVDFRAWNVPTSVEIHHRERQNLTPDTDQAKEHRG